MSSLSIDNNPNAKHEVKTEFSGTIQDWQWSFSTGAFGFPQKTVVEGSLRTAFYTGTDPEAWKAQNTDPPSDYLYKEAEIESYSYPEETGLGAYGSLLYRVYVMDGKDHLVKGVRNPEIIYGFSGSSGEDEARYRLQALVNQGRNMLAEEDPESSSIWREASYSMESEGTDYWETDGDSELSNDHYFKEWQGETAAAPDNWTAPPEEVTTVPAGRLALLGNSIPMTPWRLQSGGGWVATAEASLRKTDESVHSSTGIIRRRADRYNGQHSKGTVVIGWDSSYPINLTENQRELWLSRYLVVIEKTRQVGSGSPQVETTIHPLSHYLSTASGAASIPLDPGGLQEGTSTRVELNLLPIEVVNKDKAPVSELKVSKMQDSTDPSNVLDIDTDEDRFYVRVPGLAGSQSVSIKLETVENPLPEYNDDPTEIELVQTNGAWETPSLILVSDQEDDEEYLGDIGRDDQTNDRSHKIQLGGKVRVSEIKINGASHNLDLKVPVPIKERATIHAVVLADAGNVDLAAEEKTANERLAQVGVKITLVGGGGVRPIPAGLTDTTVRNWIPVRNEPSPEAKALVDAYGTSTLADIHVFFVKATTEPNGQTPVRGFALWGDDARNGGYGNNAFIHTAIKGPFTFVHELVHLFTKKGHYHHPNPIAGARDYAPEAPDHKTRHNLMRFGTSEGRDFGGSKRLYEEPDATQESWIKAHETVQ